ncbi:hypothetical protein ACFY1B_10025 [Streptomyces mirabilis]|jgi:hypothetical protein|uniref:hypothetical protein n=1 Tax=Streptomyces mirabilis TaxID=68239 RepID=UPI003689617B
MAAMQQRGRGAGDVNGPVHLVAEGENLTEGGQNRALVVGTFLLQVVTPVSSTAASQ